jgi:hypothetical protein
VAILADTVYANGMSVCQKNSSGQATGFPDVCLSPPPPPAGPIPVPYPNTAMASDLASGSTSVTADGGAIALEDSSYLSTSTGDEAGTQGGNVVTHKTKGKAYFMVWSFDVQVEGKGVGRNGDSMGLNCATPPYGGVHPAFIEKTDLGTIEAVDCDKPYKRERDQHSYPVAAQERMPLGKCWERGCKKPGVIRDHQPPLAVTYYSGGCHDEAAMKSAAETTNTDPAKGPAILPHCQRHSQLQSTQMKAFCKDALTVIS